MRAVGVRELKNRLSEYLRAVKAGEQVLVTEHGHVVAEINPPGQSTPPGTLPSVLELARSGRARLGAPNDRAAYPSLPAALSPGEALELLDQARGER